MNDAMLPMPGDASLAGLMPAAAALAEGLTYGELDLGADDRKAEVPRYGYRAGGFGFLVDPKHGSEVVQTGAIGALPRGGAYIAGLLNLRGNVVPVFDLDRLFGTGSGGAETRREAPLALVLDKGERAVAIALSDFPLRLTQLRALDALPLLPQQLERYVERAYMTDTGVWLEFNHEGFFLSLTEGAGASA